MIRPATTKDVQEVAALGKAFHKEAGWGDIADYDHDNCAVTLAMMAGNPDSILLVAEEDGKIVGMAGAITFPLYFNASHRSAQELFWYVKPGLRNGTGRHLIEALESEAKERGCESIIMIALDKVSPEATGRYYARRGYRAAEHSWIRRL